MADTLDPEDMGSGMLSKAARFAKYRPEYAKLTIQAAENGEEPPAFEKWAAEQDQVSQAKKDKGSVVDRLRKFVAR